MDVTGTAGTPVTLESSSVVSPSITGNSEVIYVVYRKSNETFIRTKFSTNGGSTWQYLATNPPNSNATSIESVMSNDRLHITYTVSNVVYYSNYYNGWSVRQTVSTGETGMTPRIAVWNYDSNDKVYFLYQKSDEAKWREYNVSASTWGTLYSAFSQDNVTISGFRVDGSNVVIYFIWYTNYPFQYYFAWKVFSLNNTFIRNGNADLSPINEKMYSTTTANGKSHTVFYFAHFAEQEYSDIGLWRSSDGGAFPTDQIYEYQEYMLELFHLNLSSASNEVHVIWQDEFGSNNGNNLRYIYDDQVPITPTNFAGTIYSNHPKLTWDKNEPDIAHFEIWQRFVYDVKNPGSWNLRTTTTNTSFIDYGIQLGGTPIGWINYRVRSKDMSDNYSPYTSGVSFVFGGGMSKTAGEHQSFEYSLSSNYPNPFNPSTQIKYSLAQDADITLKVYDMLGTEVAKLINETQTVGNHTVSFDAKNLSSGVYIYRITATNNGRILFTDSKQMILLR